MSVRSFDAGVELPADVAAEVRQLFAGEYFRYHYTESLGTPDRVRFVSVQGGRVVAYAAYAVAGRVAHLSNLLVARPYRDRGVGAELERARATHARDAGLDMYVSCVCDDGASQALKLRIGLRPTALKLGYRRGVAGRNSWGSAVVFMSHRGPVHEPTGRAAHLDERRNRVRYVGADAVPAEVAPDRYADVLVGRRDADRLRSRADLFYAGTDLDLTTGLLHHCFQLRNDAFVNGMKAAPAVVAAPPGVHLPGSVGAAW